MLHRRDGARCPPAVTLGCHAKEFNVGFIRPDHFVSHCQSFWVPFGTLHVGCHVPFTEEWLPSGHSTTKACLVECNRDGCPSGRFSHLHRGTLELWQSDHRVLGHLPDQGPSPPIAQFGWAASSRKNLGGSKLLPFKNDRGHCVLGDLQCYRSFFGSLPQICTSTQSCL